MYPERYLTESSAVESRSSTLVVCQGSTFDVRKTSDYSLRYRIVKTV